MNPKEVSVALRKVQERYKSEVTPTFEVRVSDMAKTAADAIDNLLAFTGLVGDLPSCNDCAFKSCPFKPKLGETVRYNCPLHSDSIGNSSNVIMLHEGQTVGAMFPDGTRFELVIKEMIAYTNEQRNYTHEIVLKGERKNESSY